MSFEIYFKTRYYKSSRNSHLFHSLKNILKNKIKYSIVEENIKSNLDKGLNVSLDIDIFKNVNIKTDNILYYSDDSDYDSDSDLELVDKPLELFEPFIKDNINEYDDNMYISDVKSDDNMYVSDVKSDDNMYILDDDNNSINDFYEDFYGEDIDEIIEFNDFNIYQTSIFDE